MTQNIGKDQSGKEIADMLCNMPSREAIGGCTKLSSEYVGAVCAERFCCARSYGCFNSSKFQWVACPDSGAGTRPKRHAVLKFPFWAVMLVSGSAKTDSFLCPPPTSSLTGVVAGTGMAQSPGLTDEGSRDGWCWRWAPFPLCPPVRSAGGSRVVRV